eukprot:SAG31_NODE_10270_length_1162_cov_1.741298_2_plen_102_part_00
MPIQAYKQPPWLVLQPKSQLKTRGLEVMHSPLLLILDAFKLKFSGPTSGVHIHEIPVIAELAKMRHPEPGGAILNGVHGDGGLPTLLAGIAQQFENVQVWK